MNFMEILHTVALFFMFFATVTPSFLECREPTVLYNHQCVTAKEACPDVQTTFSTASKTCVQCPSGYSNPGYFTDRCLTPLNPSIVKEKVPEVSLKPTPATPINSPTPLIPTSTLQPEVINGDASPSGKPDKGFPNNKVSKSTTASVDLTPPPHTIATTIKKLVTQTPKGEINIVFVVLIGLAFIILVILIVCGCNYTLNKKYQDDTEKKLADADLGKLMDTDETPV